MTDQEIIQGINALAKRVYEIEHDLGWHDTPSSLSERLNNITAEISEVWEEWRNHRDIHETYYECKVNICNLPEKHCNKCKYGKPCGIPSELADIVIWLMDYCAEHNIPIGEMIMEKLYYNSTREYRHGKRV